MTDNPRDWRAKAEKAYEDAVGLHPRDRFYTVSATYMKSIAASLIRIGDELAKNRTDKT